MQPSGGQPCEMELFSLLAPSKQRGVLQTGGRLFFEDPDLQGCLGSGLMVLRVSAFWVQVWGVLRL